MAGYHVWSPVEVCSVRQIPSMNLYSVECTESSPILQDLWQGVTEPWGYVVLEAFDGCDNLSQRVF